MAVIIILLIVGVAAIAVLLGGLRVSSRAGKQEQVVGLLMRAQEPSGGRESAKACEPVKVWRHLGPVHHTTPAQLRISKSTGALVKLAIVLGSRGVSSDRQARTFLMPDRDGKTEGATKLHVREALSAERFLTPHPPYISCDRSTNLLELL